MDYSVFENMNQAPWLKASGESDQLYMERIMRRAFARSESDAPMRINDLMEPRFISCDAVSRTLHVAFAVQEWELNPTGTMHGGLLTAAMDMSMGVLARYCLRPRQASTVQLSVNFLRPVQPEQEFHVCAQVDKAGQRILFLHAAISEPGTGKLLANTTASFL